MFAIRGPVSMFGGALVSVALFLGLGHLVGVPFDAPTFNDALEIKLPRPRPATPPQPTRRQQPQREPPVLVPGPQRIGMTDFGGSVGSGVQIMQPIIDRTGRQGIVLRGIDGDVTPIIRATPQYPPRAIKGQIEGWVRVQFSVTPAGTVRDAIVVDAEPDSIFDDAALKAIARWRYNPKVEGGEAVERVGLQAVIRFELED